MKKIFLFTMGLALSAGAFAQSTIATAIEMQPGENKHFDEQSQTRTESYWKYTPKQDEILLAQALYGCNIAGYVLDDSGNKKEAATSSYTTFDDNGKAIVRKAFAAPAGKTVYVCADGWQQLGFVAEMMESPYVQAGVTADTRGEIVPGKMQFFGSPDNWGSGHPIYAKYTADKDGILKFTAYSSSVQTITTDDNSVYDFYFDRDAYVSVASVPVKGGEQTNLAITGFGALMFTATMEQPVAGCLELPFTLSEGANTLPKAAGKYYYKITDTKAGAMTFTSNASAEGCRLSVYTSINNIYNKNSVAQSAEGSYNLTYDTEAGQGYYVEVEKPSDTAADETINFTIADIMAGDRENTAIDITDFSKEYTVAAGKTVYYKVNIPAGVKKSITVEATSGVSNSKTQVGIYRSETTNMITGNKSTRIIGDGGSTWGADYYIVWNSAESSDINFRVTLADLVAGDEATNPLAAQQGENILPADGNTYYSYTAKKAGKLQVTVASEYSYVYFPISASEWGAYETIVNGNKYAITSEAGTEYIISIYNGKKGDKIMVEETQWNPGESAITPLPAESGEYQFDDQQVNNLWLSYTAKRPGMLVIDASEIPYDYQNNIRFCYADNIEETNAIYSIETDSEGNKSVVNKMAIQAIPGQQVLVNMKLTQPHPGATVHFYERDFETGETVDMPLWLNPGESVTIPQASEFKPIWVMCTLQPGTVKFTCDAAVSALIYRGRENVDAGRGSSFTMSLQAGSQGTTTAGKYVNEKEVNKNGAGAYYLKITSCNGGTLSAEGEALVTGISNVSDSSGTKGAAFYSVNGQRLSAPQRGVNIVKMTDGTTRKIIIK